MLAGQDELPLTAMQWDVQLQQTTGQEALPVHAGDSLAILSRTARLEAVPSDGCRPDDWQLATLHLLLDAGGQLTVDGERLNYGTHPLQSDRRSASNLRIKQLRCVCVQAARTTSRQLLTEGWLLPAAAVCRQQPRQPSHSA